MAKKTIIQHALFGGSYTTHVVPVFTRIVGVLSISRGQNANGNSPFIHLTFDDTLTSFTKLVELYLTLAISSGEEKITLYTYNESQRKELDDFLVSKQTVFPPSRITLATLSDFTNQEIIDDTPQDILLYLARPDEANVRLMTKEGAVAELEDTKRAILNLLEDTRESEDKIMAQARDLAQALEDSRAYAKTAEEERATYHQLVSSIGEGVIVLDEQGLIKIVNEVAIALTGESREEMLNKKPVEALHLRNRDGSELPQSFRDAIVHTTKTINIPILSSTRKDGKVLYASSIASPIVNEKTKEQKGVIITFRNISDDVALDEARTNFISTASHQLRTPLTTIRWFIEMLQGGDAGTLNEGQKKYLAQIDEGIERMINLVNFLLRTARVETGRVSLIPIPLNIRDILNDCIEEIRPRLINKGQTITISGEELPMITLDPDYAHEVFSNLIMNAQLYGAPNDTITIEIKKGVDFAEIHITDHGIGISTEEHKRVFEKFFRSEKAIVSSPDGSGLGLSFVKTLVTDWGGNIWFESEEGKGTKFAVSVPLSGMKPREGEVTLIE